MPQSPAILVSPRFILFCQQSCKQGPNHRQHWNMGRFRLKEMGLVWVLLSAAIIGCHWCHCCFCSFDGIRLMKSEKTYPRETFKMCPYPTMSCSCSKPSCLHMHARTQAVGSSHLKILAACTLPCRTIYSSLMLAELSSLHCPLVKKLGFCPGQCYWKTVGILTVPWEVAKGQLNAIKCITWSFAFPKLYGRLGSSLVPWVFLLPFTSAQRQSRRKYLVVRTAWHAAQLDLSPDRADHLELN